MEKKAYVAPAVIVYGDVKEITKSGGADWSKPDKNWLEDDGTARTSYDPLS